MVSAIILYLVQIWYLLCMYAAVLFAIHTQHFLRSFERDSAKVIARTPQLHT